jgi:transcriptional regulator with XRE-family HTH domain
MTDKHHTDDLARLKASMTEEELEEIAAASVALDLARLVYIARERRGLTQTEAAHQTGMKQQMISRLEGGTAQPTVKTVERYLRKLGYSLEVTLIDEKCDEPIDRLVLNEDVRLGISRNKRTPDKTVGLR